MIVELCGVPGGGKSTFAHRFVERHPEAILLSLDMYRRVPEGGYSLIFALLHPYIFFWMIIFVSRYHVRGLFSYSLHLTLRACAKYQKASMSSSSMVLVDEGIAHLLCVIPGRALDSSEMRRWLSRLVCTDVIVIASAGTFHRFHREDTSIHPRVGQGAEALAVWEAAVRDNTATFMRAVEERRLEHVVIECDERVQDTGIGALAQYLVR